MRTSWRGSWSSYGSRQFFLTLIGSALLVACGAPPDEIFGDRETDLSAVPLEGLGDAAATKEAGLDDAGRDGLIATDDLAGAPVRVAEGSTRWQGVSAAGWHTCARTVGVRGGSLDALDAFIAFRGRAPQIEPLLRQHGILA